jgi:hypothetical protein
MHACQRVGLLLVAGLAVQAAATAADWPQFRGPGGTAATAEKELATEWAQGKNLLWKAEMPGPGASSPVIRGGRVYLTCYTGYGVSRDGSGAKSDLVRHLVCLDASTGKQIFSTEIKSNTPEANYSGQMTQHGYASNTPAVDDERIYLFLGTAGVRAFDLKGNLLWQAETGRGTNMWGSASSVVLEGDLVIVNAAIENNAVMAFERETGAKAWQFDIPGRSWSTPAVIHTADAAELVVSVEGYVLGIDAKTGKERWSCEGIADYTCPAVVPGQGVAYVCGGRRSQLLAVRAGALAADAGSRIIWQQRIGANVTTPVLHRGHLFGVSDQGIAYCVEAETGKIVYQQRVGGEVRAAVRPAAFQQPGQPRRRGGGGRGFGGGTQFYSSAIGLGDAILAVSRRDGAFVIAAEPEYALIAHNRLADDDTNFDGTPAVADGKIYLRSNRALYCIGK